MSGLEQALPDLRRLAEQLRRPCPWARDQTASTSVPHTVAEAHEVAVAAPARGDPQLPAHPGAPPLPV